MSDRMTTTNEICDEVVNTRHTRPLLGDSERNQLAGLAHESCSWHCAECGCCSWEYVNGNPNQVVDLVEHVDNNESFCPGCSDGPTVHGPVTMVT
jgi:hypothetical protein